MNETIINNRKGLFKNVIFIGPQYKNSRGGIGAVLATYAENIKEFKFIASYNSLYSLPKNIFFFIKAIMLLVKKLMSDKDIKIVHLHGNLKGSFYRMYVFFLVSKYLFNKKVIYHYHAGERFKVFYDEANSIIKYFLSHLLRKTDVFICLTNKFYLFFNENYIVNRIKVLHNPVSLPKFIDAETSKSPILKLLFLGRIVEPKGIFDLVNVMINHRDEFKNRVTLYIGGSDDEMILSKLIRENNVEGYVEFLGWVNGRDKEKLLATSDVFVLPSYREGMPVSILEAMSYGKAILSTSVGGIPEIVQNNRNGLLFNPGDVNQLKQCIQQLIENRPMVSQMGLVSREKVNNFLSPTVIKKLEEIYQNI